MPNAPNARGREAVVRAHRPCGGPRDRSNRTQRPLSCAHFEQLTPVLLATSIICVSLMVQAIRSMCHLTNFRTHIPHSPRATVSYRRRMWPRPRPHSLPSQLTPHPAHLLAGRCLRYLGKRMKAALPLRISSARSVCACSASRCGGC